MAQSYPLKPKYIRFTGLYGHCELLTVSTDRVINPGDAKITVTVIADPESAWMPIDDAVTLMKKCFSDCENLGLHLCDKHGAQNEDGVYRFMGRHGWVSPSFKGHRAYLSSIRSVTCSTHLLLVKRSDIVDIIKLEDAAFWNWSEAKKDFEAGLIPKTHEGVIVE